jgi:hypothetical protein
VLPHGGQKLKASPFRSNHGAIVHFSTSTPTHTPGPRTPRKSAARPIRRVQISAASAPGLRTSAVRPEPPRSRGRWLLFFCPAAAAARFRVLYFSHASGMDLCMVHGPFPFKFPRFSSFLHAPSMANPCSFHACNPLLLQPVSQIARLYRLPTSTIFKLPSAHFLLCAPTRKLAHFAPGPGVILLRFELIGADPAHILRLDLNAGAAGHLSTACTAMHEQIELQVVSLSSASWDVHDVIRVVGILVLGVEREGCKRSGAGLLLCTLRQASICLGLSWSALSSGFSQFSVHHCHHDSQTTLFTINLFWVSARPGSLLHLQFT